MDITPEQVPRHRWPATIWTAWYPAAGYWRLRGPPGSRTPRPAGGRLPSSSAWRAVPSPSSETSCTGTGPCSRPGASGACPWSFPPGRAASFSPPFWPGEGECPWIYTRGITAALDFVGMSFDEATPGCGRPPAAWTGPPSAAKEALDQLLADRVGAQLRPGTAGPVGLPLHVRPP